MNALNLQGIHSQRSTRIREMEKIKDNAAVLYIYFQHLWASRCCSYQNVYLRLTSQSRTVSKANPGMTSFQFSCLLISDSHYNVKGSTYPVCEILITVIENTVIGTSYLTNLLSSRAGLFIPSEQAAGEKELRTPFMSSGRSHVSTR